MMDLPTAGRRIGIGSPFFVGALASGLVLSGCILGRPYPSVRVDSVGLGRSPIAAVIETHWMDTDEDISDYTSRLLAREMQKSAPAPLTTAQIEALGATCPAFDLPCTYTGSITSRVVGMPEDPERQLLVNSPQRIEFFITVSRVGEGWTARAKRTRFYLPNTDR